MNSLEPHAHTSSANILKLRRLGIDMDQEFAILMREDSHICRAEGFAARARVEVNHDGRSILATLIRVTSDIRKRSIERARRKW